jgi:hypothetical protein
MKTAGTFYREQNSTTKKNPTTEETPTGVPRDDQVSESYDGRSSFVTPMTGAPYIQEKDSDRPPAYALNIHPVENNPGSAKVIPSGHGFVNKQASRVANATLKKAAMDVDTLLKKTSEDIVRKAQSISIYRPVEKDGVFQYRIQGSKGEAYLVTASLSPLQVSCSCDFWQWQGPEHHAVQNGYLYGTKKGTAAEPTRKDPDGRNLLCKHAVRCLKDLFSK